MPERWLTFSETQELLGVTSDEVRELMEAGSLRVQIVDGLVKFGEAEVRRLAHGGPSRAAEAHLHFLVDEEEEKKIEGKAYDGEMIAPPKPPALLGEDEDIVDPMDLSDEQLRNSDLLGGRDIVEFGREVAERSTAAEFTHAELEGGDEEILEPSEVELPQVEFGPLAERMSEARREEPPEAAPEPVLREPSDAAPAAAPEPISFVTDAGEAVAPAPEKPETPPVAEEEILFVAEEAAPMACPVTEEAKEEAEAPRPVSIVPPLTPETQKFEFVEEPAPKPAAPEAVETPAAPEPEPVAVAPVEAPKLEPMETYEVEAPAPTPPVTTGMDFAVDEETAEITPEEAPPPALPTPAMEPPEEKPSEEPAMEQEEAGAASAESAEPWEPAEKPAKTPPESAPVEPKPLAPQALAAGAVSAAAAEAMAAAKARKPAEAPPAAPPELALPAAGAVSEARAREIMEEIEREIAAESSKEPLPQTPRDDTISARTQGQVPKRSGPAGVPQEEAKPVTDEMKKPKPGDKPKVKKPEDIEVFDLEQAGAKKEEEFELLEEEPAGKSPAEAAPAKDKSLEEEMAELFGDEAKEASPDQAFAAPQAPKVEEDFDLSVFQKDKQEAAAPEPAPITEETLFEVEQPKEEMHEAAGDMQSVSRIRAMTEERTPASVYLYTTAVIVAVLVVAGAGMMLWYFAILRQ